MEGSAIHLLHFETYAPLCPFCRQNRNQDSCLQIYRIEHQVGERVIEGALLCSHADCQSEYPIIDGIPFIINDLKTWIAHNINIIRQRDDLTPNTESLLGDCCGSGSEFDNIRQNLSTYAYSHYGDLIEDNADDIQPTSLVQLLESGFTLLKKKEMGSQVLETGCAVGRTTFELAKYTDGLVLGIDLNYAMLRVASRILHQGRLVFPKKRVGVVYDYHACSVDFAQQERVDFWLCDATALPFKDASFSSIVSFNLLDCINAPYNHLLELDRLLQDAGHILLAAPYDWSARATPIQAWLGGHSQRNSGKGDSKALIQALLSGNHAHALKRLQLIDEIDKIPWYLQLHERSKMEYLVHLMLLQCIDPKTK